MALVEIDQFLQDRNNLKQKFKVNGEVEAKPAVPVNGTGSQIVACWNYYHPISGELLGKVIRKVTDKGKKTYTGLLAAFTKFIVEKIELFQVRNL